MSSTRRAVWRTGDVWAISFSAFFADLGYQVIEVDTSEYRKIDGGVSCMSLRF